MGIVKYEIRGKTKFAIEIIENFPSLFRVGKAVIVFVLAAKHYFDLD